MASKAIPRILGLVAVVAMAVTGAAVAFQPDEVEPAPDREEVRVAYIVESSWFATDPALVQRNLEAVARDMKTCADGEDRNCQVMVFAARGADVAAGHVPRALQPDPDIGYWYELAPNREVDNPALRADLIGDLVDRHMAAVGKEIVPEEYDDQPRGCVNLIDNMASALEQIDRHPGDRNIIVVYASGLSNCDNQPLYGVPAVPFPTADEIVAGILAKVPAGSAIVGSADHHVCVDWTEMFGMTWLDGDLYIPNEQRQVLAEAWERIVEEWEAVPGNTPGEGIRNCLTMELPTP